MGKAVEGGVLTLGPGERLYCSGILVLPACRSTRQRIAAANIFRRRVAPREIASKRAILTQLWEVSSVDRALYFF